MTGYASNTRTRRNLDALRRASWRILLTPDNPTPPDDLLFGIDNGAWTAHRQNQPFDEAAFGRLVERRGSFADFVVIPDIVAGGMRSLEFSVAWLPRLRGVRRLLLPVQNGMSVEEVSAVLRDWSGVGLFLGGDTEWKLATMYQWGMLACAARRYYHIGRVNTARRIRLAAEAGADSFDGTSATMFSCTVPLLQAARSQPSLLVPSMALGAAPEWRQEG
jgi:hypothetical protein